MIRLARSLTLCAALLGAAPASADQILPPGRVTGSTGSGDILFGALKFGKRQAGKTILQPDSIEIQGAGSTGDLSGMSVTPSAAATAGTLARLIADKAPLSTPTFTGTFRALGTFEASAQTTPPNDTFSIHQLYAVNNGPTTANGVGQTYISFASNPNFDVGHARIVDFRVSSSANQQSKLGDFTQVGSPPMASGGVGAAVAEWNLTNRGAETGYQPSISSLRTYGGTVPLQQVGGLNLVPEANFSGAAGVGTNVTYGVMVSRSSNLSSRLSDGAGASDYPRTYTGYGSDRDSLVPSARATGGDGGRFFSAWGGTSAALAPYGVGQAWGFWGHGIDLSRATFASSDPVRVKTGHEVVWEDGSGAKVAGLTVTPAGALTLTNATGATVSSVGGPWTTYTPTFTPSGGSGVSVTLNRASYEISGKTVRLQVRYQVTFTSAPNSIAISLPSGITFKDGSAGSVANISSGGGGFAVGTQGGSTVNSQGGTGVWGGSGSSMVTSITGEIN